MSAILNNILKTQRNSDSTSFLELFHKINQTFNETFEDPLGLQSALRSCKHLRNQIMFEIPFATRSLISSPSCYPEEVGGYGFSRDSRILHIVATVTGNMGRCMTHYCLEDADAEYCGLGVGQSDIVGVSQYPRMDLLHRFDYLYPHAQDNLCVMVPTADFVHRSVLESFTVSIWCCVLACLLAFSASLKVSWRLSVADAAFATFTTFVVGCFDARRRLILVWLSLFSVVMLTTFSGSFTSRLAVPKRGADIDSLHQLHAAAHEIFAMRGTSALFAKNLPPEDIVFQLSTKFKEEPSTQSVLLINLLDLWDDTDRKIFLLHSDEAIDELLRFKLFLSNSDHERSRYRRMRECALSPAYTAFAVRKGWAAARCVDALVQQLLEAGVVAKLKGDEWRAFPSLRTFRGQRLAAVGAFGVRHLYEAFALLACGLAAAAAAFLAERWRVRGRRAE